jgi:tetratricopeptide (TPR) repeat protein
MTRVKLVITVLAAALLFTPQAEAAKKKTKTSGKKAEAKAMLKAGLMDLEAKDWNAAIRRFGKSVAMDGTSPGYFLLGWSHYQRGFRLGDPETADRADAEETINAYAMAVTLDPELSQVSQPHKLYHSMAMAYEALKAYDKAVDAYKLAFAAAPKNPILPLYAARLRHRLGEPEKAAANLKLALKKAREAKKEKAVLKLLKTDAYFAALMEHPANQQAVAEFTGVQESVDVSAVASAIQLDGGIIRDSVSGASANVPESGIRMPVKNPAVLEALAQAEQAFKYRRWPAAIAGYEETLALDARTASLSPTQLSLLHERIGTAYNKLGQSTEAVRALHRSLQHMPGNSAAHYQIALAYSVSGKFGDAVKALSEALDSSPSNAELRKLMLLAKTDIELEPVRDLPAFASMMERHGDRLARR